MAQIEGCKGGIRFGKLQVVFESLQIYSEEDWQSRKVTHPSKRRARPRRGLICYQGLTGKPSTTMQLLLEASRIPSP